MKVVFLALSIAVPGLIVSGCETSDQSTTRTGSTIYAVSTKAGQQVLLTNIYKFNPDCSTPRTPRLRVVSAPSHGSVQIIRTTVKPVYGEGHVLSKCNSRQGSAVAPVYTPAPGFVGRDRVEVSSQIAGESEFFDYYTFRITVTN